MTAKEYVMHYALGQGGFESVSVDVALRAIEYAKQEAKQQMMKDALDGEVRLFDGFATYVESVGFDGNSRHLYGGDKVKLIIC